MVGDARQSRLRVRQRQQVVEVGGLMRRPGEMFRYQGGFVAGDERSEAFKMNCVERLLTANRHADAMNRNRMIGATLLESAVGRPAGAHIVSRMYLEEGLVLPLVDDDLEVLVREAGPSQPGRGKRGKAETH